MNQKPTESIKAEFYTFYNGLEWKEKETVLRISDAFQVQDDDPTLVQRPRNN